MNRSTIKAYATAIQSAALSRKSALQVELAVGFAVRLESGQSKRLARAQLCEIYAQAGLKCREPSDLEYKSVQRRIGAAIALYDFIGEKEVRQWVGDLSRKSLVDKIIEQLAPLKLATINEVILICKESKPGASSAAGRRPGVKFETTHLHFTIPSKATAEELLEAAGQLMQMAQDMVQKRQQVAHIEEPQPEPLAQAA